MNDIPGIDLLPAKLQGPALLAVILGPYLTRAWHAWTNGGGWTGIRNAILFGTNVPKTPPAPPTPAAAEKPPVPETKG